jgi:FkbM family methyltransferase
MYRSNWQHARTILKRTWNHPSNQSRRVRALASAIEWQVEKRVLRHPRDVAYYGFRLRCYPDSQSASNVIYFTPRYNPDEMDFIAAYLRPGDGFLDVGANIGTYALLARSRIGPDGWVDGFEPHPVAARRFRENVERNQLVNVTVHQAAVGETAGRVAFVATDDVSNRVASSTDVGRRTVEVEVVSLDEVLPDRRYAMGKLDVEGYETAALRGAVRHLAAGDPPVWQLEMLDHRLGKAGTSRADLVALLGDHGYRLAEVAGDAVHEGGGPRSGPPGLRWASPEGRSTQNIWAVHGDAVGDVEQRLGRPIR